MIMVDWISCAVPLGHSTPINSGNVISIDTDGFVEWRSEKRLPVEGSYSSKVSIRSEHLDYHCSHIRISGNPVKFHQGHNVWGSSDLQGLLTSTLIRVLSTVRPDLLDRDIPQFCSLGTLSKVDLTAMYDVGNEQRAHSFLMSAEKNARFRHRGAGQFSGNTLYWGKKSARWAAKMYHKGSELRSRKIKGFDPSSLEAVTKFADKALRVEFVIHGKELADRGLKRVSDWSDSTPEEEYNSYLSKLEISGNMMVTDDDLISDNLPGRLIAPLKLWRDGHDLKTMYSRATWYRYRREILDAVNIDISLDSPCKSDESSNVVPLIQIIEAKPMSIPHWAYGTDLYFEPDFYKTA